MACSMVVVLSKASIACSLEKPMSINYTKRHTVSFMNHTKTETISSERDQLPVSVEPG